jgi:hypothetical protein
LQRATHWRIWTGEERQRHSVARRNANQFSSRVRRPKLFGVAHLFVQLFYQLSLLINQQLRISNRVDEKNVRDLEVTIGRCRHTARSFATRYHNHLIQPARVEPKASLTDTE